MDDTIIQQGSFTGTGGDVTIQLRSDVDWIRVINFTNFGIPAQDEGFRFYWQRGFNQNDGLIEYYAGAGNSIASTALASLGIGGGPVPGFTLVDSSLQSTGVATALTNISTANPPVVTVASTALLKNNDVVRLTSVTGAPQLGGIDYAITVINGTTFSLSTMTPIAVAGTAGFYRKINVDPLFYPRRRVIAQITQAAEARITTTVIHGYTVGQEIRINIPAACGMQEMNGLQGTITEILGPDSFTVSINSSTFNPFTFPAAAAVPFTPAEVVPIGEDTAEALSQSVDILADATINQGYIGMILGGGDVSPGGGNADTMFWVAGKSFSNTVAP